MREGSFYHIYGIARGDVQKEFSGEPVRLEEIVSEKEGVFFFEGKRYSAHLKQFEPVELLFPSQIYVSEGALHGLDENSEEVKINEGKVSNYYARRGTHWVKYVIAPEEVTITSIDDEDQASAIAQKISPLIISLDKVRAVLHERFPSMSQEEINHLVSKLLE